MMLRGNWERGKDGLDEDSPTRKSEQTALPSI